MKKFLKGLLFTALCLAQLICNPANAAYSKDKSDTVRLIIDTNNNGEYPNNFRKSSDKIETSNGYPKLTGLEKLNSSGSAQFSENSLQIIKSSIGRSFIVADLRQESHGFVNGAAISWTGARNDLNKCLSLEEIKRIESSLLKEISLSKDLKPYNSPGYIIPLAVSSEEELVKKNNLSYIRFPVTDDERPTDEVIDSFVSFISNLPKSTWVHFHCEEGVGRTTTFLAMTDMMINSKDVSFDDIIFRQFLLGNENLISMGKNKPSKREEMLINFYKYTQENDDGFKTTWSQWIKKNNIPPYLGCSCDS